VTARPEIVIPADLLPADGRFGSGPSKIRPEALAALAATGSRLLGTSHRQAPVRGLVRRIRDGLDALFTPPEGYELLLGNGGATAFWDIAAANLIRHRSQHLVFGEFSAKFAEVSRSAPFLAEPSVVEAAVGSHPLPRPQDGVDVYALTHNETSTGVSMPVARVVGDAGALTVVDATSGAGGLAVDLSETDVYYFAPQKSFGSEGGLWLAFLSPDALARVEEVTAGGRWVPASYDLRVARVNTQADQTLNTPAIATLFLLADQIDWLLALGGLPWATARTAESAAILYGWAEASGFAHPFVADPAMRSSVVGTIDFSDGVAAADVAAVLRANGVLDVESYRRLGRNQLRIGLFPAIEPGDVRALTGCIDHVVARLDRP
jgi:phosphoserine aminotransferase